MNEAEAIAAIGEEVYFIPETMPAAVSPTTRPPSGVLQEVLAQETQAGRVVTVVVAHEAMPLERLLGVKATTTLDVIRAAYQSQYTALRNAAQANVDI